MSIRKFRKSIKKTRSKKQIGGVDGNLYYKGTTDLMDAINEENIDINVVKSLLSQPDVNLKDNEGWTALIYASNAGNIEVVTLLLSHPDIDVNLKDNEGSTALMWASSEGHVNVVTLLLSHPGIDVNLYSHNNFTAQMYANKYRHQTVVNLIEQHKLKEHLNKTIIPNHLRNREQKKVEYKGVEEVIDKKNKNTNFPNELDDYIKSYLGGKSKKHRKTKKSKKHRKSRKTKKK